MAKINVSLSDGLLAEVDAMAEMLHRSRSGLVQEATARYVADAKDERSRLERRRSIKEAMAGARELAKTVPPGRDTTELIRQDRDSRHGNAPADE
jgi:metal-responsive CopG/Arc/MetJ family transcriptional regulator